METKTVELKISQIKPNPDNPRVIKDHKFKQLVKSVTDFPEMLSIRDIVIDENNMILGGNMRYKACQDAGLKKLTVTQIIGLSPEQKKEFIIKDNANYGVWDWDQLANNFDNELLSEWGLNVWQPTEYLESEKESETPAASGAADPEAQQEIEDAKADKRVIQIEFDIEDYEEANSLYKKLRGEGQDIPGIFINALKEKL